jgi:hypothetical protein
MTARTWLPKKLTQDQLGMIPLEALAAFYDSNPAPAGFFGVIRAARAYGPFAEPTVAEIFNMGSSWRSYLHELMTDRVALEAWLHDMVAPELVPLALARALRDLPEYASLVDWDL